MIRPPGIDRVAFTEAADGDQRGDPGARAAVSHALGISGAWATVRQVHGSEVVRATEPGDQGDADGLWTTEPGLPVAVFTADCFGVALLADGAVGVAHAGWRGAKAGVVGHLVEIMENDGFAPKAAAIGPGIGSCCFEVGREVADQFPADHLKTNWGTNSVDLVAVIESQLGGLVSWSAGRCTFHEAGSYSHRRDKTSSRLATIAWVQ